MKHIPLLFLPLLLPYLISSCVTTKERPAQTSYLQTHTLTNGMDLVMFQDSKVPLVTLVLAVKAGGFTETPETNGLTHLWEHMFFKGNGHIPDQEAFNQRIQELGIIYNGDTSAEMVRYYFTLPSAFLEEAIEFMYHAIATPLFDPTELEREIEVVLDEYDRAASQPGFELNRARRRLVYRDQAHLRDPLGERDIITQTTRERLIAMKDEVFVAKNSALLLSGDFQPKQAKKLVERYFRKWKNPENWQAPKQNEFPDYPSEAQLVAIHPQASQPRFSLSFEGPKARQRPEDTYAADVLVSLLALPTGRFYQTYVESGLTTYAGLSYYTQSQAGEVHLSSSPRVEHFDKVRKALVEEPKNWLKPDYFSEEQLSDVKRSLRIGHMYGLNKPSEYVKTLAFWWSITGLDYYQNYLSKLQQVSLDDVRSFIRRYLIDQPFVSSTLVSPQDASHLGLESNIAKLTMGDAP